MPALSSSRRTQLLERLNRKKTQLNALYTKYDEIIAKGDIQSYSFNSGEGAQSVKYRGLEQMSKSIMILEAEIDSITRKLNCTGVFNLNTRRSP